MTAFEEEFVKLSDLKKELMEFGILSNAQVRKLPIHKFAYGVEYNSTGKYHNYKGQELIEARKRNGE